MNDVAKEYLPAADVAADGVALRPGVYDPLAGEAASEAQPTAKQPAKPLIEFYTPSQLKKYVVPEGHNLVGDFHLQRGTPSVLAGPGGCGKSRATLWLAILGARGEGHWFGLAMHRRFKSLIVQAENGLPRLHRDFEQVAGVENLDDYIRVTAFPGFRGFEFSNPLFRAALKKALVEWKPDLVVFDPWNDIARDSMERDYQEAFDRVRECMAVVPEAACLIVHHLRKPRAEDRHKGRNLGHLLAGSYILQSKPRCVMVLQPASDDTTDPQVVFTTAKCNDGELGARTAWERKATSFEPVAKFDFEGFDGGGRTAHEPKVREEHIRQVFEGGRRCALKQAAESLMEIADVGRSAAYEALKLSGRFAGLLVRDPDTELIGLRPAAGEAADDEPL